MTTPGTSWLSKGSLKGPKGDDGTTGAQGVSITDAEINESGDLIVTLSSGGEVNAGRAKGEPGGGIDFESSVPTVGDLPGTAPYGEARYVVADGHLYVFEEDGGGAGVDGWTDVGPIRGETGSTGPSGADGADGVSVIGAAINGSGHLILTLSAGGPFDAGVAKGADGATGAAGADGADGTQIHAIAGSTLPPPGSYPVGTIIIMGGTGELLEAN